MRGWSWPGRFLTYTQHLVAPKVPSIMATMTLITFSLDSVHLIYKYFSAPND